jgi:uncharacterized membrane protein YpjA
LKLLLAVHFLMAIQSCLEQRIGERQPLHMVVVAATAVAQCWQLKNSLAAIIQGR